MSKEERERKLRELRNDLMHERGVAAMGGAPASPGKIRAIRSNISRLLTLIREEEMKEKEAVKEEKK
ncbi:MAG: 50S ribosomal protein L29 [Thermoplasmata archaeon]